MPCNNGILTIMSRNSTTWTAVTGSWYHKETKVIRVPAALADEILDYARRLDAGTPCNNGNLTDMVEQFIEMKRTNHGQHYTQVGKPLNRNSPRWDVFNEFCQWLTSKS